jgi:hypothetical protein
MDETYHIGQCVYTINVPFMSKLNGKFAVICSENIHSGYNIDAEYYPWRIRMLDPEEDKGVVYVGLDGIRPITKEEKVIAAILKMKVRKRR